MPTPQPTSADRRPAVTVGPVTVATGTLTTTNADLEQRFNRPADVIYRKIGIHSRPLAMPDTDPKDLAIEAALPLLEHPAFNPADLAMVITSSSSVNQVCPPVSCEVLKALAERREGTGAVMAFDIMATCPGWIYALSLICDHLHQPHNRAKTALVVTTEIFTQGLDPNDFGAWASFGDAATATLVYGPDAPMPRFDPVKSAAPPRAGDAEVSVLQPSIKIYRPLTFARPDKTGVLWGPPIRTPKYMIMDGPGMRAESMPAMAEALRAALTDAEMSIGDLDVLLAHQSNHRILADLAAEVGIDPARVPTNLAYRGNTSSCALPLLIHDVRSGLVDNTRFQPGQAIALTTFGGGFTYGAAVGEVL